MLQMNWVVIASAIIGLGIAMGVALNATSLVSEQVLNPTAGLRCVRPDRRLQTALICSLAAAITHEVRTLLAAGDSSHRRGLVRN